MEISERYLRDAGGSRIEAAVQLARDLMVGEGKTHKRGYTAANAVLAADDVFNLSDNEKACVQEFIVDDDKGEDFA